MLLYVVRISSIFIISVFAIFGSICVVGAQDTDDEQSDEKESSIWDSAPIEIDSANIQVLDKISGNVFRQDVKVNQPILFGSIELRLKRCFKNSQEDCKEIYAFVEIRENGKRIFSQWLFASSPAINIFSHPVYDIRVNFS
jgi:hypothetical protein